MDNENNIKNEDTDIVSDETRLKNGEDGEMNGSDLDDSVVAEENAAEAIKKLREKLKKCEADKTEYLTGWQRAKADMINARKRDEQERGDFIKFATESLMEDLIPVLESFDMAMGNTEAWEKADKNWRVGVEYIYSQLKKVLTDRGLVEINPLNQKFDHFLHEAASHDSVNDKSLDQVVIGVVQKGYSLNGKVLKPAKVRVGEFKS